MVKTEAAFPTEQSCNEESILVAKYFQQQGYLAIPKCAKIKMGVSL
jgi:hypothetical protein